MGVAINSRQAVSPLVRLVEGEEKLETPDLPERVLSQNWGRRPSKIILLPAWCLKLRLTTVRMTSHKRSDDFLRWRAVDRLEGCQSEVRVGRWVQRS
ncbi:hypothetical protein TNCV_1126521 [Trichonephila clavipes]|nr:hypothetical protein TNCV_1126521 [Trichonephila clavipes]